MTRELTVYKYENQNQRIRVDDGKEWACAPDACRILGLGNVTNALKPIPSCHLKTFKVDITDKSGRKSSRDMSFIDEAGLNQLIMRSNKPEAKRYQEWVFGTVLPSIRKTGAYAAPGLLAPPELTSLIATAKDLVLTMKALVGSYHSLNIFELAEYYKRYMLACGLTQAELAKRCGVTQGHIANTIRLLELPDKVRFMIICGELSETHGRCLLQLHGNPALITELARAAIKKSMTIDELDAVIKQVMPGNGHASN